jgi:uncharacterized protein (DUF1697 family)
MPRFVALLRGVNVGKANRVPMAGFKPLLEQLRYSNVRTLLSSGNAVFTSSGRSAQKHAEGIADGLQATFGVTTPVIVKSAAEFSVILSQIPIMPPEAEHSRFLVAFAMSEASLKALSPLIDLAQAPERLVITRQAAYLYCPRGLLKSKVGEAMLGKTGRAVTTRNWATALKLDALLGAA